MKNEEIYLSIAGFTIQISFIRDAEYVKFEDYFILQTKRYYKNFIKNNSEEKDDYTIEVKNKREFQTLQNKDKKKLFINFYEQVSSKKCRTFYHVSGMQFQIIIRRVTHELLLKNNGFILHASAVKKNNKAYVFLGDSGAGKSTIMTLLSPQLTPMGDDTIIIRKQEGKYYCYSSSAIEKNAWFQKSGERVHLDKVFFLKQNKTHAATQLIRREKIIALLGKQVYSDIDDLTSQFPNMTKFVNSFDRFYRLDFALTDNVQLGNIITE